jgi:hypothetical protein
VNTGTVPVAARSFISSASSWGWAHRLPNRPERGGASVVVRGWESQPHGEGRQRICEGRRLQCRKTHRRTAGPRWKRPAHATSGYRGCRPNFIIGRRPTLAADLNNPKDRVRGEPVALRGARRVRRAAWGNGPGAIPAPRPRPTQPVGLGGRAAGGCAGQRPDRTHGPGTGRARAALGVLACRADRGWVSSSELAPVAVANFGSTGWVGLVDFLAASGGCGLAGA